MHIHYAQQPLIKSIFLAGPTPRNKATASWRPEACRILAAQGFTGTVFVPETDGFFPNDSYDNQVHWEWEALNQATVVAFWVPRVIKTMPAFTTNVEFGMMCQSGKVVLGYPQGAPKMTYLDKLAKRYKMSIQPTLETVLTEAIAATRREFGA